MNRRSVYLPKDLDERLRRLSSELGHTPSQLIQEAVGTLTKVWQANESPSPKAISLGARGGEYLNFAAIEEWFGQPASRVREDPEPKGSGRQLVADTGLSFRPKWSERSRREKATPAQFLLKHYGPDVESGELTATALRSADRPLYLALRACARRRTLSPSVHKLVMQVQRTATRKANIRYLSDEDLSDIRRALEIVRANLPNMQASNSVKANIDTDLIIARAEVDRPSPRPKFIKQFLESLRDNIAKASGAAAVAGLAAIGAVLAKHFGLY